MADENKMLAAALRYAGMGLAVFPLGFKKKTPATPDGFKSATTDKEHIKNWWGKSPGDKNNIGIATGKISGGLVVIDIDKGEKKGKNGLETFSEWLDRYGAFPRTATVITGGGGMHYLFRSDKPEKSRIGLYPGIDVRAEGGYIVAPPSIHPNGNTYKWSEDPIIYGFAEIDEIVNAFLHPLEDLGKGSFEIGSEIIEGERNHTLFKAACSLRDKGFDEQAIYSAIMAENQSKCVPPLDDGEINTLVKSALKYEPEHRYDVTTEKGIIKPAKKKIITDLSMKTVADVEVEPVNWLIPGYIPQGQITSLVGDGGSGKTSVWCSIAADISAGRKTFLESEMPGVWKTGNPQKVLLFSAEDSVKHVLKPKLMKYDADLRNIRFLDLKDERFPEVKFDSKLLEDLTVCHRPGLIVFDPIQSFIPSEINMGRRNAMRRCLNPLIGLGEKYGTTFLLVVHTNKQDGLWGRKRMADSSDVWDISRSVLMVGETQEDGIRYLSQEKSNYGPLEQTVLFSLNDGTVEFKEYTTKKDRDYIKAWAYDNKQNSPAKGLAKQAAKDFILEYLDGGEKEVSEIDEMGKAQGHSTNALRNAKAELKEENRINYRYEGKKNESRGRKCFLYAV